MANIPRAFSLALFRAHIENGLSVAAGVGLSGALLGWGLGFNAAIAAATGAICVSFADQPDPLERKPWFLGFAVLLAVLFTALGSLAPFIPWLFFAATAVTGLTAGLISAYGKRAISLSMTAAIAFVFAMGQHFATPGDAIFRLGAFAAGSAIYAVYAEGFALAFDDRVRRLLLAEAMQGFAAYLRAKAGLYDPHARGAFRGLIETYAVLVDRLQAARDTVFSRTRHRMQKKRVDALSALLNCFETMLAADADFRLLRSSRRSGLNRHIGTLLLKMADDVEGLTLALRNRHAQVSPLVPASQALVTAVANANRDEPEGQAMDHAFFVTANKLALAEKQIAVLAAALDSATQPSRLTSELDLSLFRQSPPQGVAVLAAQFDMTQPALRYAIRLGLAMTAGLAITVTFPHFAHANWVLLTIALIMRANYSVTSQRRWHRITGTLIGCVLAAGLIAMLPPPLLLAAILLAVELSHAYVGVHYRVTAICASISSLLLLHFTTPLGHGLFFERVGDTLIGAGLSYVFSFLLPNWEHNDVPGIIRKLVAADAAFADAALRRQTVPQAYRLARKKTMDAVALLSGSIRRLADEPGNNSRRLAALNELLGANYVLASGLASMMTLMKLRADELDATLADAQIAGARGRVAALLAGDALAQTAEAAAPASTPASPLADAQGFAMAVLANRLDHIERDARKVARLTGRRAIRA